MFAEKVTITLSTLLMMTVVATCGLSFGTSSAGENRWIIAEGRSIISRKSPETARQEALLNAENVALEKAWTEISSSRLFLRREGKTKTMDDYQLSITSRSYGVIIEKHVLQDTIISELSKTGKQILVNVVRLRALVNFEEPDGPSPYAITLDLNRTSFEEGEELKLKVSVTKSCYLIIFTVDANGMAYIIYPRRSDEMRKLADQSIVEFPGDDSPVELYLLPGHDIDYEQVWVVATEEPLLLSPSDVMYSDSESGFMDSKTIELVRLQTRIVKIPFSKRGQAVATYTIHK